MHLCIYVHILVFEHFSPASIGGTILVLDVKQCHLDKNLKVLVPFGPKHFE